MTTWRKSLAPTLAVLLFGIVAIGIFLVGRIDSASTLGSESTESSKSTLGSQPPESGVQQFVIEHSLLESPAFRDLDEAQQLALVSQTTSLYDVYVNKTLSDFISLMQDWGASTPDERLRTALERFWPDGEIPHVIDMHLDQVGATKPNTDVRNGQRGFVNPPDPDGWRQMLVKSQFEFPEATSDSGFDSHLLIETPVHLSDGSPGTLRHRFRWDDRTSRWIPSAVMLSAPANVAALPPPF